MKANKIFYAVGLLALTACSADTDLSELSDRVPINLGYTTLTANETRTAAATDLNDATIATGGSVTVKIKNNGADVSTYASYTYTTASGGAMTAPTPPPYYPTGLTNIDILAYYPANAAETFQVNADQTSDATYEASDLMVATVTNQAKTTDAVVLAFGHKMAKIVVTATKGDGVNTIQTITLKNVKRQVTFTPTTGAVGDATAITGTDVTVFKEGSSTSGSGAAVIPAQTITGALLEIVTDQGTATYDVGTTGKAFAAGSKYTMNITVNKPAVGVTNSVSWTNTGELTVNPTVEGDNAPDGVELVDLGLYVGGVTSGKKLYWANMNVGATTVTGYGTYFAWGETSGYTEGGTNIKTYFYWTTYAWCQNAYNNLTKYCPTAKQSDYWFDTSATNVAADNKTELELGDDAARANWGGSWRMPTKAEFDALMTLTKQWVADYNSTGVAGYTFTGNGHTLFLPAAGSRDGTSVYGQGSYGYYWSSLLAGDPYLAYRLYFNSRVAYVGRDGDGRYYGYTVRAVQSE